MSVGLYLDEHVPGPVAEALRSRGVDVLTVQEDHFSGKPDIDVLNRALALGRTVFTQDADFLAEACHRQRAAQPFAGVIYAHQLKCAIGRTVTDLELIAKASSTEEYLGRVEFLPM